MYIVPHIPHQNPSQQSTNLLAFIHRHLLVLQIELSHYILINHTNFVPLIRNFTTHLTLIYIKFLTPKSKLATNLGIPSTIYTQTSARLANGIVSLLFGSIWLIPNTQNPFFSLCFGPFHHHQAAGIYYSLYTKHSAQLQVWQLPSFLNWAIFCCFAVAALLAPLARRGT